VEGDANFFQLVPPGTNNGFVATSLVRAWVACPGPVGSVFIPCQPGIDYCGYQDSWIANPLPAGSLALSQALYFWNGSAWAVCKTTVPWMYSQVQSSTLTYTGGPQNEIGPKVCGAGRYKIETGAYAWDVSSQGWAGGWLQSGGINSN